MRQQGFTILELLIVAVFITAFASLVFSGFGDSSRSAKEATLRSNLATLRDMIERYHADHGRFPGGNSVFFGSDCPVNGGRAYLTSGESSMRVELGLYSDKLGYVCTRPLDGYVYGPYTEVRSVFTNPVTGSNDIRTIGTGDLVIEPDGAGGGFKYDFYTGRIIANDTGTDLSGIPFSEY